MAKAVFVHKPESRYDDRPWERYEFPAMYRRVVEDGVGDWIVYYEPKGAYGGTGRLAYYAVARLAGVTSRPGSPGRFDAHVERGSYLPLERAVPRMVEGRMVERMLEAAPGRPIRAGANQLAVRRLDDAAFERILRHGFPAGVDRAPARPDGLSEGPQAPFERPLVETLLVRAFRERSFRRQVLAAYEGTCAMSGLSLRNGGGWMEVEAAHIRAVAEGGPDSVRNGLALSATLHRMFDRGLVSVGPEEDGFPILVSENKVPREVQDRLLTPERRLGVPQDPRLRPHPDFLEHHRLHRFGGGDGSGVWQG